MAHCLAYQGPICSLCCTLDARCGDPCKPHASLAAQWSGTLRWLLPRRAWPYLDTGLGHFRLLMLIIVPLLATVFGLLYHQEVRAVSHLLDAAALSEGTLSNVPRHKLCDGGAAHFAYFLWRRKESRSPAGARPGLPRQPSACPANWAVGPKPGPDGSQPAAVARFASCAGPTTDTACAASGRFSGTLSWSVGCAWPTSSP
jgi:hypothetical protein